MKIRVGFGYDVHPLVIGKDLSWMDGSERVCEPSAEYKTNKPDKAVDSQLPSAV